MLIPRNGVHPKQALFEAARVRDVLDIFGLNKWVGRLLKRHFAIWGIRMLSFEAFNLVFPSFPVYMDASSFYHTSERWRLTDLMRDFARSFIYQRYIETYRNPRSDLDGRPVAMAFPYGGYRGGLVAHNAIVDAGGFRCVFDAPDDMPPHRITIEPFIGFITYFARGGWTPGSPPNALVQPPRVERGIPIEPWMVRLCGGAGGDTLLLAFLLRVLRSESAHDRRHVRVLDGGRAVAIDSDALRAETGLSAKQLKYARRRLVDLGMLRTWTRKRLVHYALDAERLAACANPQVPFVVEEDYGSVDDSDAFEAPE